LHWHLVVTNRSVALERQILFQRVSVIWVVRDVKDQVHRVFVDTFLFNDVLNLESVKTHADAFLNQRFFLDSLEVVDHLVWILFTSKRKLLSYLGSILLLCWSWVNVSLLEEACQLSRNFLQSFFGKLVSVFSEFGKWHELNDISAHISLKLLGV